MDVVKGACDENRDPGPWCHIVDELDPFPGDLLEFQRTGFCRWGICMEKGKVVRFKPFEGEYVKHNSDEFVNGRIVTASLEKAMGDSMARINNKSHLHLKPNEFDSIQSAVDHLTQNPNSKLCYHIYKFNCEHFATFLKFGLSFSEQEHSVTTLLETISGKTGNDLKQALNQIHEKLKKRKCQHQWEENLEAATANPTRTPKFVMSGSFFPKGGLSESETTSSEFPDIGVVFFPPVDISFPDGISHPRRSHIQTYRPEPPPRDTSPRPSHRSTSTFPSTSNTTNIFTPTDSSILPD